MADSPSTASGLLNDRESPIPPFMDDLQVVFQNGNQNKCQIKVRDEPITQMEPLPPNEVLPVEDHIKDLCPKIILESIGEEPTNEQKLIVLGYTFTFISLCLEAIILYLTFVIYTWYTTSCLYVLLLLLFDYLLECVGITYDQLPIMGYRIYKCFFITMLFLCLWPGGFGLFCHFIVISGCRQCLRHISNVNVDELLEKLDNSYAKNKQN